CEISFVKSTVQFIRNNNYQVDRLVLNAILSQHINIWYPA
ncbi:MAG: hypothetical protein ACI8ZV_000812, partial [Chitinophagales bacterium]